MSMMKGMLVAMATILVIVLVPIAVAIVLDYGDHLRNKRELEEMVTEYHRREDLTLLKICGNFREFQKTPAGRDSHAMDNLCNELEARMYPWVGTGTLSVTTNQ